MKHTFLLFCLFTTSLASAQDSARVIFYRPSKFAGSMVSYRISHGATEVARMMPGSVAQYKTVAGLQTFIGKTEGERSITLHLKAGQTYYIECGITMGAMVGLPTFRQVYSYEARQELMKLNPALAAIIKDDVVQIGEQQKDTVRALNNLFTRKRKGGTSRALWFGMFGLASLVGTVSSDSPDPGNYIFIGLCGIMAGTGLGNASRFDHNHLEPVLQAYTHGAGLPASVRSKLRKKDFK